MPRTPRPALVVVTRRVGRGLPTPLEGARRLGPVPGLFLRWSAGPTADARPWSFLALAGPRALAAPVWPGGARLDRLLARARPRPVSVHGPRLPFASGYAGLIGYEARQGVERTPPPRRPPLGFPVLWLGRVPAVLALDHATGALYLSGSGRTRRAAERALERLHARLLAPPGPRPAAANRPGAGGAPRAQVAPRAYQRAVERVRQHVLAGDLFQANLSQRFDARAPADAVTLFERLVAAQPAPHMTLLVLPGGRAVLSASPERFLAVQGARVRTEPMKGTRPRGATPRADRALRRELAASRKDRAELAMIVDLSRNDLARVCRAGSVRVVAARRLEAFARVHQASAVVEGRLARGRDRVDLLQAAFPPGSVTGAPKVRALEVIDALEGEGRGPYCGALGWLDDGGAMDLSVAIRTLLLAGRRVCYRVGGGITLRSVPREEWRETLTKGRGLVAALRAGARAAAAR